MNIASLVSGGVDSSVSIHLLKEAGYDPHIFYIRIGMEDEAGFVDCPSEEDIEITTYIAHKYGCRLDIISLHKEYWERVIDYTISTVRSGLTPNPDMMCNKLIKFGSFEEKYGHEFDAISTGHYADIGEIQGIKYLKTARDKIKDQTYFLAELNYRQISRIMFPLSRLLKSEVRKIAETNKLPSAARPDSQGICFLGKINFNELIKRYVGEKEGRIIVKSSGKLLGKHKGNWFYTIGQRKGLGLSQGPWFVVDKNIEENIVFVAHADDPEPHHRSEIDLGAFHFISNENNKDPNIVMDIKFKIRHHPGFNSGKLIRNGNDYRILCDEPISGVAPGQFGVVYDKEAVYCLGSGTIK